MDPVILSIVAFVGVTALVGGIAFVMRDFGSSTAEDRLEVLTGRTSAETETTRIVKEQLMREGSAGAAGLFHGVTKKFENMANLFEQADSPIGGDAFFGISAFCAVIGVAAAWLTNAAVPLYPVAALLFGGLPLGWLLWRRKRRFKRFAMQLPDAMELVARALRSGHSLASGLNVVCQEMPAPVASEFEMAYEEQNLGVPIEQALKSMLKRMPNMDLKFFVTAVAIQRQSGGDLAEILDKIGYIIRERFKIMGQVQALTGEGRISGIVLMALPIALFVAVYYLNPDYVSLLFTEELGRKMIAGAAILQVAGAITIKKIIAIKI
jgi:tight adherence protein B